MLRAQRTFEAALARGRTRAGRAGRLPGRRAQLFLRIRTRRAGRACRRRPRLGRALSASVQSRRRTWRRAQTARSGAGRPCVARGTRISMSVLEDLGRETTGFFSYAGGAALLLADSAQFIGKLRIRVRETIEQAYTLGVQSWAHRAPDLAVHGHGVLARIREPGGGTTASATSSAARSRSRWRASSARCSRPSSSPGRSGAAISAELGSMVVTEQIEALQSLGLSPTRMLVVPRLVALVVMLPLLTVFADIVSIIGGATSPTSSPTSATNRSSIRPAPRCPSSTSAKGS